MQFAVVLKYNTNAAPATWNYTLSMQTSADLLTAVNNAIAAQQAVPGTLTVAMVVAGEAP